MTPASLKRGGFTDGAEAFNTIPESRDSGLIEARVRLQLSTRLQPIPESRDSGLIEASPKLPAPPTLQQFRSHVTPASLKHLLLQEQSFEPGNSGVT